MTEEWGPWINYNGEGYFVGIRPGMIAQIKARINGEVICSAPMIVSGAIMYARIIEGPGEEVLAYRVRKPRALQQLIDLAATVPSTPERVDA